MQIGNAEQPMKGTLSEVRFLNLCLSDYLLYVEVAGCLTVEKAGYEVALEVIGLYIFSRGECTLQDKGLDLDPTEVAQELEKV